MVAMMMGTFAIQYYTWTAQVTVSPLTNTFTVSAAVTESGATMAEENWGTPATGSTVAVPAWDGSSENARITVQDDVDLYFKIEDAAATALDAGFTDLLVRIMIFRTGDNTETWAGENVDLWVIEGDSANTSIENAATKGGSHYDSSDTYDIVIWIFENTENVASSSGTLDIPIEIYAKEP